MTWKRLNNHLYRREDGAEATPLLPPWSVPPPFRGYWVGYASHGEPLALTLFPTVQALAAHFNDQVE